MKRELGWRRESIAAAVNEVSKWPAHNPKSETFKVIQGRANNQLEMTVTCSSVVVASVGP